MMNGGPAELSILSYLLQISCGSVETFAGAFSGGTVSSTGNSIAAARFDPSSPLGSNAGRCKASAMTSQTHLRHLDSRRRQADRN